MMDLMVRLKSPSWVPKKLGIDVSSRQFYKTANDRTYLLIIMLKRLTFFKSSGSASFFNFPRYVGLRLSQGMKMVRSLESPGTVCGGNSKSHSQEIVACSRPLSGLRVRRVSFKIRVYRFSEWVVSCDVTSRRSSSNHTHCRLWQCLAVCQHSPTSPKYCPH